MIYVLLDILFYSITYFKSCFISIMFNKLKIDEYVLSYILVSYYSKEYIYYFILFILMYIVNKWIINRINIKDIYKIIINYLLFINIRIDLNSILFMLILVFFLEYMPYNILGD